MKTSTEWISTRRILPERILSAYPIVRTKPSVPRLTPPQMQMHSLALREEREAQNKLLAEGIASELINREKDQPIGLSTMVNANYDESVIANANSNPYRYIGKPLSPCDSRDALN